MRAVSYICLDNVEVANEARTLGYIANGLASGPTASASCACDAISDGPYVSPATDDAPWYEPSRPDSAEYLGLWAHDIRILNVLQRSSRQRARGGAQLGNMTPTQRIVQVEGLMFASTARGMAYGERWLTDVLAGYDCDGCPDGTLELLPACPDGLEGARSVLAEAEAYWLASGWSGSGDMVDGTGNGHDATPSGTVTKLDYTDTQYVYFSGDGGSVRADDAPYVSLVGDHGIRAALAPTDWTPTADMTVYAKWGSAGQRSIRLIIDTTGALTLEWSADGTAVLSETSTAVTGFTNGTLHGIRADIDVDDGAGNWIVTFYTRSDLTEDPADLDAKMQDNTNWTLLGTAVTNAAGPTTVFDSTAPVEVGGSVSGTVDLYTGKVYLVRVASGGTFTRKNVIVDFNPTNSGNATGLSWGDGINMWEVISPAAPDRPIVLVNRDLILLDVDGYFEVPDAANLDFATSDSPMTVAVAYSHGPLPATNTVLLAKKTDDATSAGYLLLQRDSAAERGGRFTLADGVNRAQDQTNTIDEGVTTTLIGVRRPSDDRMEAYKDHVGSATSTPDDTAILSNSEVLRIGRLSGAASDNPSAWMFSGAAIFREALSDAELYVLAQELKGEGPRGQQYFRTLRQVGVVDGPEFEQAQNIPECTMQRVSFQIAAGIPELLAPPLPLLEDVNVAAGASRFVMISTDRWVGDAGTVLILEAADGDVTDVAITGRVSLDGTCTTNTGGSPCVEYTIPSLPQYHVLTFDSVERKVTDWDPTMKRNVSGMGLVEFDGRWKWLDIAQCSSVCLRVTNNGAVPVRVSLEQVNREL